MRPTQESWGYRALQIVLKVLVAIVCLFYAWSLLMELAAIPCTLPKSTLPENPGTWDVLVDLSDLSMHQLGRYIRILGVQYNIVDHTRTGLSCSQTIAARLPVMWRHFRAVVALNHEERDRQFMKSLVSMSDEIHDDQEEDDQHLMEMLSRLRDVRGTDDIKKKKEAL